MRLAVIITTFASCQALSWNVDPSSQDGRPAYAQIARRRVDLPAAARPWGATAAVVKRASGTLPRRQNDLPAAVAANNTVPWSAATRTPTPFTSTDTISSIFTASIGVPTAALSASSPAATPARDTSTLTRYARLAAAANSDCSTPIGLQAVSRIGSNDTQAQGFIATDPNAQEIIIAFRVLADEAALADAFLDDDTATHSLSSVDPSANSALSALGSVLGNGSQVDNATLTMYSDVAASLNNQIDSAVQNASGSQYTLSFVGYAEGGALATLAALGYLGSQATTTTAGGAVQIITFGQPPIFDSKTAAIVNNVFVGPSVSRYVRVTKDMNAATLAFSNVTEADVPSADRTARDQAIYGLHSFVGKSKQDLYVQAGTELYSATSDGSQPQLCRSAANSCSSATLKKVDTSNMLRLAARDQRMATNPGGLGYSSQHGGSCSYCVGLGCLGCTQSASANGSSSEPLNVLQAYASTVAAQQNGTATDLSRAIAATGGVNGTQTLTPTKTVSGARAKLAFAGSGTVVPRASESAYVSDFAHFGGIRVSPAEIAHFFDLDAQNATNADKPASRRLARRQDDSSFVSAGEIAVAIADAHAAPTPASTPAAARKLHRRDAGAQGDVYLGVDMTTPSDQYCSADPKLPSKAIAGIVTTNIDGLPMAGTSAASKLDAPPPTLSLAVALLVPALFAAAVL